VVVAVEIGIMVEQVVLEDIEKVKLHNVVIHQVQ
tara:strand:+ start:102 stop:203 length:102 start_codon:yes stop_codon:yes gene_type:complete